MLLSKLYTEPRVFFKPIEFIDGVNFVYAKKDNPKDKKNSLNGVGKSLVLNLIDFCLLSSETPHIVDLKDNIDLADIRIVLEFEVDGHFYIIKRSFFSPDKDILFGSLDGELKSYDNTHGDKELSKILCDLVFYNPDYSGRYFNSWFRSLMPFFIKKQSSKSKVNFKDPIKYLHDGVTEMEAIPYHLFLMGIDNALFYKNFSVCSEIKSKKPALREVESLVRDKYHLESIAQAESEIDKLKQKVTTYEANIENFALEKQYGDAEEEANQLTEQIKDLWLQNSSDRDRIALYQESFALSDNLNTARVKRLYGDLNVLLAENIKITLDEAVKFRRELSKSRKDFLSSEVAILERSVKGRSRSIEELQKRKVDIFKFLQAKEAIKDLTAAYLDLSHRREQLTDLEGNIRTYRDLKVEVAEREAVAAQLYAEIESFLQTIRLQLQSFRETFFRIHDAIYLESEGKADFIFTPNSAKDSKIDIDIVLPSGLSYGKNKGRTLVYDLSMLFHAIEKGIRCPRFLAHDGIFDGIDKAHFVHLISFLEEQLTSGIRFQYIVTLNQDGEIKDEDFGEGAEDLTRKKIEEEAIAVLTPSAPLFGKRWD